MGDLAENLSSYMLFVIWVCILCIILNVCLHIPHTLLALGQYKTMYRSTTLRSLRPLNSTRPYATVTNDPLDKYQDSRAAYFAFDIENSIGNYIADADGNKLLDVYAQIASIAIGYNNPKLFEAAKSDKWVRAMINRPALGNFPPKDWVKSLENSFLRVAPNGLNHIFTSMCGSCANEIAFKACFIHAQAQKRGAGIAFSKEELESCMNNQPPGSPPYSILSFSGAFHGRTLGTLSATRSKSIHKLDIPALNWPKATFPTIKYPYEEYDAENKKSEQQSLTELENLIKNWKVPVAAVIIEPIQGEGGDNAASPAFYQNIRDLTKTLGVMMIVDEVQTGVGATGKFWAHEYWNLTTPPDIVTFSKKMQAAGFYHNLELRPAQPYRNFNTWMGDPIRAYQAGVIIDTILEKGLLSVVQDSGKYTRNGLGELAKKYPKYVSGVRGQGTHLAFTCESAEARDKLVHAVRQRGVNSGGSGERTCRLRPMLVFQKNHADIYLNTLEDAIKSMPK
ncbi:4-aminobutyrate---2-oxoglutarate transaminase [Synchytrium endobioticum]|uniref:4-aminobutyrate aminotransferase n=1 Tax=Synchytrium endobioticum TaxID=286115 RepID=A0A507DP97_9FUNG|nr:4-aminobutyrate---2-oxoglutarate transaminase [Synchytrium endobioticum]